MKDFLLSHENLIKAAVVKHIVANCQKLVKDVNPSVIGAITFRDIRVIDDIILVPTNVRENTLAFITEFRILDSTISVQGLVDRDFTVEILKTSSMDNIIEQIDKNTLSINLALSVENDIQKTIG